MIETPVDAVSEIVQRRTWNSKSFRMPGDKVRLIVSCGIEHYLDDDKKFQDIDIKPVVDGATVVCDKVPYKFRLNDDYSSFEYESRQGGSATISLTRVGANIPKKVSPEIEGNKVWLREIQNNVDICIILKADGVRVYKYIKAVGAPKQFRWQLDYAKEKAFNVVTDTQGWDNDAEADPRTDERDKKRPIEVTHITTIPANIAGNRERVIFTENWTGRTQYRDPVTKVISWKTDAAYPVVIDADIVEEITATGDDGSERRSTWYNTNAPVSGGGPYNITGTIYNPVTISYSQLAGWRFQLNVPQGSNIDLAILKLNVKGKWYNNYAAYTLYGSDIDNLSAWSNTNRPRTQVKTGASIAVSAPIGQGMRIHTITSIIQEIVDREGFLQNNYIGLFANPDSGQTYAYTKVEDSENVGTSPPTLEVDYTAPVSDVVTKQFQNVNLGADLFDGTISRA